MTPVTMIGATSAIITAMRMNATPRASLPATVSSGANSAIRPAMSKVSAKAAIQSGLMLPRCAVRAAASRVAQTRPRVTRIVHSFEGAAEMKTNVAQMSISTRPNRGCHSSAALPG